MSSYNGHRNWNAWNVNLWLFNDEELNKMVCRHLRYLNKDEAAVKILRELKSMGIYNTPDGAPYNKTNIRLALAD
jgi:hypothetical protein